LPIIYAVLHEFSGNAGDLNAIQECFSTKGWVVVSAINVLSWGYTCVDTTGIYPFTEYFFSP
jgi:hypothetical protein